MSENALVVEYAKLRFIKLCERWPTIKIEAFLNESSFGFVVYLVADEYEYTSLLSDLKTAGIAAETRRIRGNAYEVYIDAPEVRIPVKTEQNEA